MATKKECDRCKKQWTLERRQGSRGIQPVDEKLCSVKVNIPFYPKTRPGQDNNGISKSFDMCQDCARALVRFIDNSSDKA